MPRTQAWLLSSYLKQQPAAPLCDEGGDHFPTKGYTASFSSLAARNATFLLALILIASPVAGLRPNGDRTDAGVR
jgi:hypothetical protein